MIEYHFQDDYTEGCHPRILELLSKSNLDSQIGYGDDFYSLEAKKKIRSKIEDEKAAVFFVSGDALVACFDDNISDDTFKEIAKTQPLKVVFKDSSFAKTEEKINLETIFKEISSETKITVI